VTVLLLCWVVFPVILFGLALGSGLALERVATIRLPTALLAPVGLAVVIVLARATVAWEQTVSLTVPAFAAVAAAGIATSVERLRELDWTAFATAGVVYAVYGAPILASGSATFAGYITLDDTATWLALTDHLMAHGDASGGLAPSTHEATISYLLTGYPFGSLLTLGIGQELIRQDGAWLFQPYLAFLAGMLGLAFWTLLSPVVTSRVLRAVLTVVAAQPALLYAYAFWSGVKELAAAALVAAAAALLHPLSGGATVRAVLPLATVTAAAVLTLSMGGLLWLGVILVAAAVMTLMQARRAVALGVGAVTLCAALLAAGALATEGSFVRSALANLRGADDIGNLIEPLSRLQLVGIWPAGDFRVPPTDRTATHVLIAITIASAAVGFGWAVRRRQFPIASYIAGSFAGVLVLFAVGSPWLEAKGMATASPAILLAAVLAAGMCFESGRRVESFMLLGTIAFGVLWSNALAYRDVSLAPRGQLRELETIGERFAGQGPALMTEYQPYGVRHFLRRLDAEGAAELRRRPVPLDDGSTLEKGEFADLDAFRLDGLLVYRTLVLRRSPVGSRPSSVYHLVWQGRHYEVWQRPEPVRRSIVDRIPAGGSTDPASLVPCETVMSFARRLAPGSRLVSAVRSPTAVLDLAPTLQPATWSSNPADPASVVPLTAGTAVGELTVQRAGSYELWLGGSFRQRVEIRLDEGLVRARRAQLNTAGQFNTFGVVSLTAGTHTVRISYGGESFLRPASGGPQWALGPLIAARAERPAMISTLPRNARTLCGRRVDWIEAIGAG
jgi:hypothetical protein